MGSVIALARLLGAMVCAVMAIVGFAPSANADDGASFDQLPLANALAARVAGDLERTRIVVDVEGEVTPAVYVLPQPNRLVLDLPGLSFTPMNQSEVEARGLVSAFRYGPFAPERGRVVVDLADHAVIDDVLMLAAIDGQPARLVLDLVRSDEAGFEAEVERTRDAFLASVEAPKENRLDMVSGTGRPIVVIDPGHGGIDSGAVSRSGVLEKSVVLNFAQAFADRLRASGRFDVHMTRDDDVFIPLAGRVRFAQSLNADLFISVHADSLVRHRDLRGATVYTLSDRASDAIAQQLVDNEARSEMLAGMDVRETATTEVADILIDLTRRETTRFSLAFAENVVSEISTATRMVNNPHRSAGFRVLKAPEIPSILLELGFLSNEDDVRLLIDEDWQARTVQALSTAVDRFFEQRVASAP
ncbi:MAG: N-acetylmuramoyl-L-alanine amidase [Cohaesibacteraceae bacterium]